MAVCLTSLNNFHQAQSEYVLAREFSERHNMPTLVLQADYNIAYLYYLRGEYRRAIDRLIATRESCRASGDRQHFALCHFDLSTIYLELNLTAEAEQLQQGTSGEKGARERLISDQLARASKRVLLLRSALTVFYSSIGLLVATSIAIGLVAALRWSYGWVPVTIGLCGACALLYGTLLLVREGRLAVGSTLQELSYAREVVERNRGGAG